MFRLVSQWGINSVAQLRMKSKNEYRASAVDDDDSCSPVTVYKVGVGAHIGQVKAWLWWCTRRCENRRQSDRVKEEPNFFKTISRGQQLSWSCGCLATSIIRKLKKVLGIGVIYRLEVVK